MSRGYLPQELSIEEDADSTIIEYLKKSAGITQIEELYTLDEMKIPGAIIGKAIYEGKILLRDLQKFIDQYVSTVNVLYLVPRIFVIPLNRKFVIIIRTKILE